MIDKRLLVFLFVIISLVFPGDRLSQNLAKLRQVQSEIRQLEAKESLIAEKLDALERRERIEKKILQTLRLRAKKLTERISLISDSISALSQKKHLQWKKYLLVLRRLYMLPEPDIIEIILGDSSIEDVSASIVYLSSLISYRKAEMENLEREIGALSRLKTKLAYSSDSLGCVIALQKRLVDSLRTTRGKYRSLISRVRGERKSYERLLAKLKESQKKLVILLEERRKYGGKFGKLFGKLPCPVGGDCKIVRDFGNIKDKRFGVSFVNPGVDIVAGSDRYAKSVADGVVADVVWLPGYKNVVIIRHDGGFYSIYGNLEDAVVRKGQKVRTGSKIGIVAESDWLNDIPVLHFEIRRGREREDPKLWIGSVKI